MPIAGKTDWTSWILPVTALVVGPAAALARIVRVETLSVLGEDFVRTARAKRLRPRLVYLRHVLPNALTATLTIGGLLLSALVAGTVLIETIFAWPGLGPTMVTAIINKDYPLVQGIVLVYGASGAADQPGGRHRAGAGRPALDDPGRVTDDRPDQHCRRCRRSRGESRPQGAGEGGEPCSARRPGWRRSWPPSCCWPWPCSRRSSGARPLQTKDLDALSEGPSAAHPFGTDALGRDILLRVLVATRLSLELALGATLVGVVVGVLLGVAAQRARPPRSAGSWWPR